jgi:hypothetical protein
MNDTLLIALIAGVLIIAILAWDNRHHPDVWDD